ncbi:hypothetical protein VTL71DRAFT_16123 [Oculimacula yallundae]|uniref:Zn(2)-C6 fungal-type domain-containing protein n=1 Tax=Oculimacula yallundae TaxID=86028 RepID=A0ABR4CDL4_9HELO
MSHNRPKSVADQQVSNRACEACRAHKIRCLPNDTGSSRVCQRCAKTDRECVFAAPARRRQRKRTDTRVAELEREVSAMRTLFQQEKQDAPATLAPNPPQSWVSGQKDRSGTASEHSPAIPARYPESLATPASCPMLTDLTPPGADYQSPPEFSPESDFIERGLMSMKEATRLFTSYNENLAQHYPAVTFTPNVTAEELRRTKPTLFLATVAAASGQLGSQIYSILNSELLHAYAHKTVVEALKSLELVQTMIILSIWYFPPGVFSKLKYYEFIHMAAIMGLDIGLGSNPQSSRDRRSKVAEEFHVDEMDIEKRRTFLVCYMITTGVALSTRRPNMLRYTTWIGECLGTLSSNPNASQMDKYLVSWVKLMKITEEIGLALGFDDVNNTASLSESRNQIAISGFQKTLQSWKSLAGPDVNGMYRVPRNQKIQQSSCLLKSDAIMIQYHHSQLFLHEIALYDDHPPEDFRPAFDLRKVLSIHTIPGAKDSFIDATANLIASAQAMLDIFLSMDIPVLRCLPVYNFVRMAYSIIILVKVYISSKSPTSKIGEVVHRESLKVGTYLKASIDLLFAAVGPIECRAPYTFLGMLMRLHGWLKGQDSSQVFTAPPDDSPALDQDWLPPMPQVIYRDTRRNTELSPREGYVPDPLEHTVDDFEIGMDANMNAQFMGNMQLDGGAGFDSSQYVLFEGVDAYDLGFNSWLPGTSAEGVLESSSQLPGLYDYGYQEDHNSSI